MNAVNAVRFSGKNSSGKRLRDPLFSPYKRVSTFVLKKMERRSIQEYAEEYKNRLKAGEDLDFVAYCRSYGLRVDSVRQWMRRHGMDPKAIQLGIVLERYHCKQLEDQAVCQSVAGEMIPLQFTGREKVKETRLVDAEKLLKGIHITFPDGGIIQIKECVAETLCHFIHLYYGRKEDTCSR